MQKSNLAPINQGARLVFHKIFLDWLESAKTSEIDILDKALAQYPNADSRSMPTFIRQSLAIAQRREGLPVSLVQLLQEKNWPPVESSDEVRVISA